VGQTYEIFIAEMSRTSRQPAESVRQTPEFPIAETQPNKQVTSRICIRQTHETSLRQTVDTSIVFVSRFSLQQLGRLLGKGVESERYFLMQASKLLMNRSIASAGRLVQSLILAIVKIVKCRSSPQ